MRELLEAVRALLDCDANDVEGALERLSDA